MSLSIGVIDPSPDDPHEFLVGDLPTPAIDRRLLLATFPVGVAALSGASWLLSRQLEDPVAGEWRTGWTPVFRLMTISALRR